MVDWTNYPCKGGMKYVKEFMEDSLSTFQGLPRTEYLLESRACYEKKNINASNPSEYLFGQGEKLSKRLGENVGCKGKYSLWNLVGFPNESRIW